LQTHPFSSLMANASPLMKPAYTCGTHISVFEIDDESAFISTLNAHAAEFVPSFYPIEDNSVEARHVDDIMQLMHHLVSVSDSEHLMCAQQFADADYPVDDDTSYYLEYQDSMCRDLHVAASKPKGNTYGRKRQSRDRPRERQSR